MHYQLEHRRAVSPGAGAPCLIGAGRRCLAGCAVAVLALVVFAGLFAVARNAQAAGNGTLTVTATVTPGIQLVFVDAAGASETTTGYCPITSSGTPDVGLDFGACSRTQQCVRQCVRFNKLPGNEFTADSTFDLIVTKANATSGSYTVQAWLDSLPPAGSEMRINGTPLSLAAQVIGGQTTNSYAVRAPQTLLFDVTNNMPAGTISRTIHYLATSN